MAFKMTPGIKSPKMKAGNGLPSNMMMKPCGGPIMTPPKGTPLNAEGDEKEGYNPGGTRLSSFGGGSTKINTYDSDKAQLAKPLSRELISRGYNVIKNKAAQGRMDAYNKSTKKTKRKNKAINPSAFIDDTGKIKNAISDFGSDKNTTKETKQTKFDPFYDSPGAQKDFKTTKTPKVTKTRNKAKTLATDPITGLKNETQLKAKGPKAENIVKSGKNIGKEKKDVKPTVAPKLATRRVSEPKKEVKSTRLSKRTEKTRAKGEAALASGDKQKALRLRRRVDRQEARSAKREVRGAKREAIKKINNKKTVKVVEPKKIVKAAKPKDKKKSSSGLASGPMMHKGDGKKHAKIQETPEMRAKYVKSLIAKGYEPVKGKPNQFRRGTGNGVLTIGEYTGNIPNNDSPAEEIRKAMKAGDARKKKENKKIKK